MNYMLKNKIILTVLFAVLLSGCGYKETNTQMRDVAFLKFTKSSFKEYSIIVNNQYKFNLSSCTQNSTNDQCSDDTKNKIYEVKSGNVIVNVFNKKEELILRKEMYLGSSNTMEITLP